MVAARALDKGEATFPTYYPMDAEEDARRAGNRAFSEIEQAEFNKKRRRNRRKLRNWAGWLLPDHQVSKCGRVVSRELEHNNQAYVAIRRGENGAYWSGVVTCKSVWDCPDCAARLAAERQKEVSALVKEHMSP
jgi:hypothetical protein